MAKFAVLFLILGLSAGLWLGFNPQAHAQTIRKWDSTKSAFLKIKAEAAAQVRDLNSRLTTSIQVSPQNFDGASISAFCFFRLETSF